MTVISIMLFSYAKQCKYITMTAKSLLYFLGFNKTQYRTRAHNNREAGLPKHMLLCPLKCTFNIMEYKFNNQELLEVSCN